ncbi:hypothetical protein [Candidatus Tisiphia endosymbiont of Sialis lutaria]|uniref:hypothetical protein n=1 Tax=Candidatus Tisiphia endosymbiont of Sialis lutaria TaxID=2029164 RepID=UPI00312C72A5
MVKLVKSTHTQISDKGVDKEVLIDQLIKFDHTIELPSDKKLGSFILDLKKSTTTIHELGGASTSSYHYDRTVSEIARERS